jgi:predicted nucleic acid-binding protein
VSLAYFDTSAFVRCMVGEPGSETAQRVWAATEDVAAVRLAYPEARAALARACRLGRLTARGHSAVKVICAEMWQELAVVEVDEALAASAADLAEREALRGYDAVHLAAALTVACDVLVSGDDELCEAGLRQGLDIVNLNATS